MNQLMGREDPSMISAMIGGGVVKILSKSISSFQGNINILTSLITWVDYIGMCVLRKIFILEKFALRVSRDEVVTGL